MRKKMGTERYAMVIDVETLCHYHSCSVACKAENRVPLGSFALGKKIIEKGKYPNITRHFLPHRAINAIASCVINYPVQATWKREDGIVIIDEHHASDNTVWLCPYNARY
jgi:tetrathionate reductase subunit B